MVFSQFEDWWNRLHCSAPVFAKVVKELEELIFRSGEQHAIIAQRLNMIFSNLCISTYQLDRTKHCRHGWHQSTLTQTRPIYVDLHRSTSIHIFTFHLSLVWVSMGWESNRWKEIEAKLLRLPYECPDWFPIDVPVPWTKTWNFITVAVQFMCDPSFGFLGRSLLP